MIANIAHAKLKTKELIYPYATGGVIAVVGIILSINTTQYTFLVPMSLVLASIFSFVVMLIKMNGIVKININLKKLYLALLYSIPFMGSTFFYTVSPSLLHSILIVMGFGIYFMFVLYLFILKGAEIE